MKTPKFWPLDFDPEGAIYENPSWDLPGFKRGKIGSGEKPFRSAGKSRQR